MESLLADLRYASRKLSSGRGATLVAIVSIGLGVGVSTAIFGAVDQILISALPFRSPSASSCSRTATTMTSLFRSPTEETRHRRCGP